MIKISVIIPVYKVPLEFLRECFDSLHAQTMQECEFIIVSDGAPYEERSVCQEYVQKDSRFKFFQKSHAGVSVARNYGLQKAKGENIAFLDCDDFFHFDSLSVFLKNLGQADVILANTQLFWNNTKCKKLFKTKILGLQQIQIDQIPNFAICGYLFKKEIINKYSLKFNESLKLSEDRVFIYSYLSKVQSICILENIVYSYRQHQNSTSHKQYSIDVTIQQLRATALIDQILIDDHRVTPRVRDKIISDYIRAALIGYYKSNIQDSNNFSIIRSSYINLLQHHSFFFYYNCIRSKITALVSVALHL